MKAQCLILGSHNGFAEDHVLSEALVLGK